MKVRIGAGCVRLRSGKTGIAGANRNVDQCGEAEVAYKGQRNEIKAGPLPAQNLF
jgi:hypothetical protein